MDRTTEDLIEELKMESKKFNLLALLVGFEKRTDFVFASDRDGLTKLNDLVKAGGEPVGLLGFTLDRDSNVGTVRARRLQEYQDEEWAAKYLSAHVRIFAENIIAKGKAKSFKHESDWIN